MQCEAQKSLQLQGSRDTGKPRPKTYLADLRRRHCNETVVNKTNPLDVKPE